MLNLKTPKGTLDLNPKQSYTFNSIISKVKTIFEQHNGVPITTPTFEIREILMNKYGEDTKLIYNLEDQGGDICSLRYDLTVPFSRFLCMNKIQKIKRYQIANVFRRDNPSFKTGRLRELTQADFDICGSGLPMVNDAEILKIIYDILCALELPYTFTIKISDRRILIGLLKIAGVSEELQRTACSTIDKVGKLTTEEICDELLTKGVNDSSIDFIKRIILNNNDKSDIETLNLLKGLLAESKDKANNSNLNDFETAIEEFGLLFEYLKIFEIKNIKFDLSLARGLDYYTGLIVEAVYNGVDIGSVVGGGRYDGLCSSLSENTLNVPCVGFSVGISRLFSIVPLKDIDFDIFVGSGYGLNLEDRMKILNELWRMGYKAETFTGKRVNFKEQLEYAKENNFKMAIFTGDNEILKGVYNIIDLKTMEKKEVSREELETIIKTIY